MERRVPADAAWRLHSRSGLRRQPGRRRLEWRKYQCGLHRWRRQRWPAAFCKVRSNREYDSAGEGRATPVQVPFDAGQGRPPHARGSGGHQLVYARACLGLLQQHAGAPEQVRTRLRPHGLRCPPQLHEQLHVFAALGARRARGSAKAPSAGCWATGRLPACSLPYQARRSASAPARRVCAHRTTRRRLTSRASRKCSVGSVRMSCGSTRRSSLRRPPLTWGNVRAQRAADRTGLCQSRCVDCEDHPVRIAPRRNPG